MDLLQDPLFKSKYQKHKLRVKLWESDFMDKYGRKPNKNDIKEADATIREAYKMYWKLKTRALEETLTDITFCEDTNVSVDSVSTVSEEKDQVPNTICVVKDAENIDPQNTTVAADEVTCRNVEGVWGKHLSKENEVISKNHGTAVRRSSSFQLSQNKFASTSFTKRNPRKSLSAAKLKSKTEQNNDATACASMDQTEETSEDGYDIDESRTVFDHSVKVIHKEMKPVVQSVNMIQQLIKGPVIINRNLDQGWLDRCTKQNDVEVRTTCNPNRLSGTSDSGIESMECSIHSPKENTFTSKSPEISDEEDYVCNSDSEEERRNKRIRNFKKRLSEEGSHVNKRHCSDSAVEPTALYSDDQRVDIPVVEPKTTIDTTIAKDTPPLYLERLKGTEFNKSSTIDTHIPHEHPQISEQDQTNILKSNENQMITCKTTVTEKNVDADYTEKVVKVRKPRKKAAPMNDTSDGLKDNLDEDPEYTKPKTRAKRATRTKKLRDKDNLDEDPEYTKPKTRAKGATRIKKLQGTNIEINASSDKKQKIAKPKRRSKKEKEIADEAEEQDELESASTEESKVPVYGIETLNTVPRFAIPAAATKNLITDFAQSISASTEPHHPIHVKEKLSDKEKLMQKIATGQVNDNFVRINLKKKVFVRGKKSFSFAKYKRNQWKQRKKELDSSESNLDLLDSLEKNGVLKCFKCGDIGHFSRYCPAGKSDGLIPLEEVDDTLNYPTLEQAEKMASEAALSAHSTRIHSIPERPSHLLTTNASEMSEKEEEDPADFMKDIDASEFLEEMVIPQGHQIPQELVARLLPPKRHLIEPLYKLKEDQSLIETPNDVFEALKLFGHKEFRPGQEKAIMRILSGQSTLVTLSTGAGKSLCYQIPAYLYAKCYPCITLVVSPLVSLMDDQVTGVPSFLSAACLHTNQPPKVRDTIMDMTKQGKINILLVSPEAVVAGEKSTGFGALIRQLPPIAFACIDEAHCISQWSDNFRPSYLMICRVLKEKLNVKTVLGLTATATQTTAESIVAHLGIPDGMNGVISDVPVPRNLFLTVSKDENRDQALISLLKSERFKECNSIIVYCTRREECERIAGLLRVSLQDIHNTGKAKVSNVAEAYHAGLSAHRRKIVQQAFMSGQVKIVVATVAFGMGINKADIRSVIHYNMPATFEGYVQEVGRAGRDGLPAQCHLFLNTARNSDKWELRRHIHANGVDRHMIRRLLEKVFVPCSCRRDIEKAQGKRCPGHEVAIPIDETVKALDISEEIISTLLCYLELHPKRYITVLSSVYVRAKVSSYNGPQALKQAAQSSPPLAMAIALDLKKGISHENSSVIEFPVVDIASAIGWDSGVVKSHLKNLEWRTVNGSSKRSAISVRFDTLGLRVKAPGDLAEAELDEALDALVARTQTREESSLRQLEAIDFALHKFSVPSVKHCFVVDDDVIKNSEQLKDVIRDYFKFGIPKNDIDIDTQKPLANEAEIAGDVRSLVLSYSDTNFTARAVARIFHGIQSPNYPALFWSKCRFWRTHLSADFNAIRRIATKEILALR